VTAATQPLYVLDAAPPRSCALSRHACFIYPGTFPGALCLKANGLVLSALVASEACGLDACSAGTGLLPCVGGMQPIGSLL